jgi:hypothetical protein
MLSLRAFSTLILGSCFALMGCAVDAQAPMPFEAGDLEVPLEATGLGLGNGITPACFWDHGTQKGLRKLAGDALDSTGTGKLPLMPDVPAGCYRVIQDTVECALKDGYELVNPHNGDVYKGMAALAPEWAEKALEDKAAREWVTACLLQRLNAFGIIVSILIEGDHSSIYDDPTQDNDFPALESSAGGDLFSVDENDIDERKPAFEAYVCAEKDLSEGCPGGGFFQLDTRICDTAGSLCGMVFLGDCESACVANGSYWDCNNNPHTVRVQLEKLECPKR